MEPIRPDDDELRAERPDSSKRSARPSPEARTRPSPKARRNDDAKTPAAPNPPYRGERKSGGGGSGMLWLLVIVLACAAGAGWYIQNERIQALENQIEEADGWVRQSKLALARFEGTLSETGENLQQAGVSLEEQLASQKVRLDTADSEIRKLWVVANERNKQQLEQQAKAISELEASISRDREAVASVQSAVKEAQATLSDALKKQQAERAELVAGISAVQASASALKTELAAESKNIAAVSQKLGAVTQDIDERIAAPIRRFEQEQKLTTNSMESRIAALEKEISSLASGNRLAALQRELAGLKKTVEVIDSSRSQMTSRLVRLSQEVNDVQTRLAGQ